jgi:ubiquinone/menaquinone biosynthesis C-methylase UbiE
MNQNWLFEQTKYNVSQWDLTMEYFHPESSKYLRNPNDYVNRLCYECNYLDAVKTLDWGKLLKPQTVALDLACGGGWLTAYLSSFEQIKLIFALDSSNRFLNELVLPTVKILNGNPSKVNLIEGLFTPLLFEDSTLDLVVSSSSLHHAESLEGVLKEIKRVLKKDGLLIILNETPYSNTRHILSSVRTFFRIIKKLVLKKYVNSSASISACGHLYDPNLGDKNYPTWYWLKALNNAGFESIEIQNSKLPTVKRTKMPGLTHFICNMK